ncbi:MAG: hypothetical protein GAK28_03154 [Luteibacter sp.]|uniref:RDD family protein n=1 Tax=Luteibacter sp. TaxID=1886636 RepID=UPI001385489F|nr:RDD family protein [Luteibacter sp.]KAF1005672.1 MAG: hypothetical protein GAK28_03154 [Luteibacter sp.]
MQVWIGRNGERFGPYTEDDVRQWLRDGTCRADELGWYEGMTDWRPLDELFPDARPEPATSATPPPVPPFFAAVNEEVQPEYATFWTRVGAWIIDYLILMVPFTVVSIVMGVGGMATELLRNVESNQTAAIAAYAEAVRPVGYIFAAIGFIYYTLFESSKWQATPGKMAVGIRVTDTAGKRVSMARAAGRNAIRLVNAMGAFVPFVFYIVTAFTQRKQGVHDLLASTYVLVGRADKQPVAEPAPRQGGTGTSGRFDA